MEEVPTSRFLRQFSKENSLLQRNKLAAQIRGIRLGQEVVRVGNQAEVALIDEDLSQRQVETNTTQQGIEELESELEEISDAKFSTLRSFFRSRKIRGGRKEYETLKAGLESTRMYSDEVRARHERGEADVSSNTRRLIENFYEDETKKWENAGFDEDDIKRFFNEEHLSSLSLDDYSLLVRRFPRYMLAHVTRQGIRDHVGHMYHVAGADEYSDGFMRIAEDGRLRSPLGVYIAQGAKDEAVAYFLNLDAMESREQALERLKEFAQSGEGGNYSDRMAIHFAAEEVADMYYGSERGNEIFITYPSALIATQYHFNGDLTKDGGGYWNDQWVWANEEKGISLNAGVVFLPRYTPVGKKTGSRYELDEHMRPIVNEQLVASVKALVASEELAELAAIKYDLPTNSEFNRPDYTRGKRFAALSRNKNGPIIEAWRHRLAEQYGITDEIEQMTILTTSFVNDLEAIKGFTPNYVERVLGKNGLYYERVKDAVPAEDFWESYFTTYPNRQPSKVVYYSGDDPTQALKSWQRGKYTTQGHPGFERNEVGRDSAEANAGIDRFVSIAKKMIDDRFPAKSLVPG